MASMPRTPSALAPEIAARLKRDGDGLVTAVVQQYDTGEVLMVGWMDDEALHRTLTTVRRSGAAAGVRTGSKARLPGTGSG
jgi:phosphoribosyl-AMP cyclohydrolase